ncbi:OmpA family protein [Marinobacter bohaiensis]|uniref:OmpA family protein n=1 Tax=Marinobacter bohaiensis TaxID=2201898 RepID=UPI000DAD1EF9|nr:OmpA family protein [Marinobacter bohaiensis]
MTFPQPLSWRPLGIAVLAASVAAPALADEQHIYLNPFIGYQYFDDNRDLSESDTYGGGIEYRFLPRWAIEAVYSRGDADRKYISGSSDFDDYRLDGLYYFGDPDETWNPYLATGAGHTEFESVGSGIAGETRLNLGGGIRYNISELISLRGDVREFYSLDEESFDTLASVGMSFAFGVGSSEPEPVDTDNDGVTDDRDQCPGTPSGVGVDANGCEPDGDNDGVPNRLDECPNTPAGASVNSRGCELDSDNDGVVDSRDQCPNTTAGADVDETGCQGVMEEVETFTLEVMFPTNSATIDDRYDDQLRRVADFLEEHPDTVVEVGGHTDNTGAASYNQTLSQRRAEAVADRLVETLGVDADRVSARGYGEAEPIADNSTAQGRRENRRVEASVQMAR